MKTPLNVASVCWFIESNFSWKSLSTDCRFEVELEKKSHQVANYYKPVDFKRHAVCESLTALASNHWWTRWKPSLTSKKEKIDFHGKKISLLNVCSLKSQNYFSVKGHKKAYSLTIRLIDDKMRKRQKALRFAEISKVPHASLNISLLSLLRSKAKLFELLNDSSMIRILSVRSFQLTKVIKKKNGKWILFRLCQRFREFTHKTLRNALNCLFKAFEAKCLSLNPNGHRCLIRLRFIQTWTQSTRNFPSFSRNLLDFQAA